MADDEVKNSRVKIVHNGKELEGAYASGIEKAQVDFEINVAGMFELKLTLYDITKGGWTGVDLEAFKISDLIEIHMGLEQTEKIITGEITAIEPDYSQCASLTLRGYDKMQRLTYGNNDHSFQDMTDSDVVKEVAGKAKLSVKAEATTAKHKEIPQRGESNYQFLLRRAKRIGYELLYQNDELIFRPSAEAEEPTITLEYTKDLISFNATMAALREGSEVEVRSWDAVKKEEIVVKKSKEAANSTMGGKKNGFDYSAQVSDSKIVITDEAVVDAEEAELVAKAKYNEQLKNFIKGNGESVGNNKIKAGMAVKIKGVGGAFTGSYYLNKVTHTYDLECGYLVQFQANRTGA